MTHSRVDHSRHVSRDLSSSGARGGASALRFGLNNLMKIKKEAEEGERRRQNAEENANPLPATSSAINR